jgi:hypothetical protein
MKSTKDGSGHFHAVRFYETPESLCRIVAEFLGEGLVSSQPALVIASEPHGQGIVQELRARHFDIDRMMAAGDLLVLDAREIMSTFMRDGVPDADLFQASASEILTGMSRGRDHQPIRAYGEMVDLLWKDGHSVAAIRLEMLWNRLAMSHDFSLLCGYSMGNFYKDASMSDICNAHTHVLGADGSASAAQKQSHLIN